MGSLHPPNNPEQDLMSRIYSLSTDAFRCIFISIKIWQDFASSDKLKMKKGGAIYLLIVSSLAGVWSELKTENAIMIS